ncbi:hypothetical protein BAUCODRAFT_37707 [Baudoinia panamericana UAMH 10762]|uniref:Uncharacterized protein n=1 Tax=Baudoinia panamericana (strain UAMH 10762) TaxID=717646 RepID=M2M8Q9_BAUPA|nr:uncharacterized protein BAUCODRAFT_37707 [Baudoinia panamericana UAMH 10762]EMC92791.1 hypothetical protein BAUCODRAFT_37707 [Baudoinia panamericana UAMH 10762]
MAKQNSEAAQWLAQFHAQLAESEATESVKHEHSASQPHRPSPQDACASRLPCSDPEFRLKQTDASSLDSYRRP